MFAICQRYVNCYCFFVGYAFAFYSAVMRAISRIDHSDRGIFFVEHEFRVHDKWPKMAGGNKLKRKLLPAVSD